LCVSFGSWPLHQVLVEEVCRRVVVTEEIRSPNTTRHIGIQLKQNNIGRPGKSCRGSGKRKPKTTPSSYKRCSTTGPVTPSSIGIGSELSSPKGNVCCLGDTGTTTAPAHRLSSGQCPGHLRLQLSNPLNNRNG